MAEGIGSRLKNGWNAFVRRETDELYMPDLSGGVSYGTSSGRPFSHIRSGVSKDSIIVPIFNRIGIDVASVDIKHARVDDENSYIEDIKSYLSECLTFGANLDQESAAFFRDAVMTLCEEGAIAIVPTESKGNPLFSDSFDPVSLRVGTVTQWFPRHVRINVWNDEFGRLEEITLPKRVVALVENPLYAVMNEPNSTLQRLLNKLRLLDVVDEQSGAGKLDIIVQLPYVIKSEAKREQAEQRRKDLEAQLADSKFGIGYTDGSERITQLNRPAENNLMGQVEYLTNMLYGQLGLTPEIISGTADEQTMLNYNNRTIEPFLTAITQSMTRAFISRTGRAQGQRILFSRDPFKLMSAEKLAEMTDKLTRNEVATANDIRTKAFRWKPSKDPKADELRNSNVSQPIDELAARQHMRAIPSGQDAGDDAVEAELIDTDPESAEVNRELSTLVADLEELLTIVDEE